MSEVESQLKSLDSLKDVKDIDEIDFSAMDLIRGKTPDDIKEKCLKLCKQYLSGNWDQQTIDTIEVKRVSGGLTNQLYYCGISSPLATSSVPQEVAIRIYGAKYFNKFDKESKERLTDVIIALLVSENGLGPKVYGIFEDGQILHYYKHKQFKLEEQKDQALVTEVFQKLARVHAMDVPIRKTHWLFREIDCFYEQAEKNLNNGLNKLIEELNCETLLEHNLKDEINWTKDLIIKSKSPMTFTHNDFRSSNIMILENNNNNNNIKVGNQIVLCDFEYSSYGYRGHDLGTIISEWGRQWEDIKTVQQFPDDSTLRTLIDIYIKESENIFGKSYSENPLNSVEQLLIEIKIFLLNQTLFFVLWFLKDDEAINETFPLDEKVKMQLSENMYKNYWHLKNQFLKQNVFDV